LRKIKPNFDFFLLAAPFFKKTALWYWNDCKDRKKKKELLSNRNAFNILRNWMQGKQTKV
jgi:hypothetical protein